MTMHMNLLTRPVRITSPECAEELFYSGKCKREDAREGDMVRVRKYGKLKTQTDLQCSPIYLYFSTFIYPNLTRNLYVVIEAVQHRQYCVRSMGYGVVIIPEDVSIANPGNERNMYTEVYNRKISIISIHVSIDRYISSLLLSLPLCFCLLRDIHIGELSSPPNPIIAISDPSVPRLP